MQKLRDSEVSEKQSFWKLGDYFGKEVFSLSCLLLEIISDQTTWFFCPIEAACGAAASVTTRKLIQPACSAVLSNPQKRADGK